VRLLEIDVLEKMGRLNYHMACACTHNAAHNFVYGPDKKRQARAAPREQKKMLVSYMTLPRCMQRRAVLTCLVAPFGCIISPLLQHFNTKRVAFLKHRIGSASSSQPHKCNHEKHPVPGSTVHNCLPDAAAPPTSHTRIDSVPAKTSVERPRVPAAAARLRARPDAAAAAHI
jgi:hypothetical protein